MRAVKKCAARVAQKVVPIQWRVKTRDNEEIQRYQRCQVDWELIEKRKGLHPILRPIEPQYEEITPEREVMTEDIKDTNELWVGHLSEKYTINFSKVYEDWVQVLVIANDLPFDADQKAGQAIQRPRELTSEDLKIHPLQLLQDWFQFPYSLFDDPTGQVMPTPAQPLLLPQADTEGVEGIESAEDYLIDIIADTLVIEVHRRPREETSDNLVIDFSQLILDWSRVFNEPTVELMPTPTQPPLPSQADIEGVEGIEPAEGIADTVVIEAEPNEHLLDPVLEVNTTPDQHRRRHRRRREEPQPRPAEPEVRPDIDEVSSDSGLETIEEVIHFCFYFWSNFQWNITFLDRDRFFGRFG